MIQNINDIYNLIEQREFTLPVDKINTPYGKFTLSNAATGDRVDLTLGYKNIEISAFHKMNSEYYETISSSNARGRAIYQRLREILLIKRIAADIHAIDEYTKNIKHTPHR